jgi:hypothetical protein
MPRFLIKGGDHAGLANCVVTQILSCQQLNWLRKETFCCHSEARFSPKNLSVNWT